MVQTLKTSAAAKNVPFAFRAYSPERLREVSAVAFGEFRSNSSCPLTPPILTFSRREKGPDRMDHMR